MIQGGAVSKREGGLSMTRAIFAGMLFLAGLALCGCSSDQVPPWAMAAAQYRYHSARTAPTHGGSVRITKQLTHPSAVDVHPDDAEVNSAKIYSDTRNPTQDVTSTVPSKYKDLAVRLQESERRQKEDNRRINAAMAICRC